MEPLQSPISLSSSVGRARALRFMTKACLDQDGEGGFRAANDFEIPFLTLNMNSVKLHCNFFA